jgi:hypothetical protein
MTRPSPSADPAATDDRDVTEDRVAAHREVADGGDVTDGGGATDSGDRADVRGDVTDDRMATADGEDQVDPADRDRPDDRGMVNETELKDDGGVAGERLDQAADSDRRFGDEDVPGSHVAAGAGATDTAAETEPARAPADGNLAPGQTANDPVAALWGANLVERYRGEWRDLQLRFVDDPRAATGEAANLVDSAVTSLTNTLVAQKQSLDGWQSAEGDDTEVMRMALRRYRDFLDRLLGL